MSRNTRITRRKPSKTLTPGWGLGIAATLMIAEGGNFLANLPSAALLGAVSVSILTAAFAMHRWWKSRAEASRWLEVELGVSLVIASFFAVRAFAAFDIDAFPLIYLIVALLVTFQSRLSSAVVLGTALLLTWAPAALQFYDGQHELDLRPLLIRSAFISLFGLLSAAVHGLELLERRQRHRREVVEERERMLRQARELRLLSTRRSDVDISPEQKTELIAREAVDTVNHAIYLTVALLKSGLNAHTVVLLWFDVKAEYLNIKELLSDSDHIIEGGLEPARGIIGSITRQREALQLDDLKSGFRGIPYYTEPQDITNFAGIPVIEDGHLRGVLCADRKGNRPFTTDDVKLMEETASYLVRAIENQRQFSVMERSKHELTRFFEASRRLNGVLTPEQVYEVAFSSADQIAPWEVAAITLFDSEQHHVAAVDARGPFEALKSLLNQDFESDGGLVSMAVKNRHYLPYGGTVRDGEIQLFSGAPSIEGLRSLMVMPLIVLDQPVGTFIVGHSQPNLFTRERREMLEVVCNQVAVTLHSAQLYGRMEQMATTDGLTGLANHRTFQTKLEETIARSRRSQRAFAVILTDIDHFKNVNDTYGHPVGDEVLRQVSRCFQDNLRETDICARYGGEEFALILEDTDLENAIVKANRLRTEVKKLIFTTEKGPFSISISMGVGYWPQDAEHKQALIDQTDQALYHSKHNGRDRVTAWADMLRKAS